MQSESYWAVVWRQYKKSKTGIAALFVLILFFVVGIYAPLFASSKPFLVIWNHKLYFPLLRYLFYAGFYTKPIDLFFNLLMFTLPLALFGIWFFKKRGRKFFLAGMALSQILLFSWILSGGVKNPVKEGALLVARKSASEGHLRYHEDPLLAPFAPQMSWSLDVEHLCDYAKLNQLLKYKHLQAQHQWLASARTLYVQKTGREMPTLWYVWERNETAQAKQLQSTLQEMEKGYQKARDQLPELIEAYRPFSHAFIMAKYLLEHPASEAEKKEGGNQLATVVNEAFSYRAPLAQVRHTILTYQQAQGELNYLNEKKEWLETESKKMHILIPSLFRSFHWEEDAGGAQEANRYVPWWELTRINRKDLAASLLFGIRISIVVGTLAVALSLLIGIPLGTISGYFAGKTDLAICRLIEIWEAMPLFFMLLLVVAITQTKSIFLVIAVLGTFGWTGFSRFIRSEVLKQRKLPYVEACHSLGYTHKRIMFSHILPNAIPPILTLLPFSMMAAITSEAGLSFLGLGEEGSTSWGVLMDEGRSAFPAESYLLWPPALLLTLLLVAIALAGDALRDALDPKMR
jgi:peptide/nickel transport system permease protein